jgi:hypothetical protein
MAIDRTHWHMIRQAMVTGKALSAGYPTCSCTAGTMPRSMQEGDRPAGAEDSQSCSRSITAGNGADLR